MWTKIKKATGTGNKRAPRDVPAVSRARTGSKNAVLVLPAPMVTAERCDIYSDGNGKLAFAQGRKGEYRVFKPSPNAACRAVSIPATMAHRIPYGTTDAVLTRDGDMLVLDLNQFAV